jgi:hypothetical protein
MAGGRRKRYEIAVPTAEMVITGAKKYIKIRGQDLGNVGRSCSKTNSLNVK